MRSVIYYVAGLYQRRFKPPIHLLHGSALSIQSAIVCDEQHIHENPVTRVIIDLFTKTTHFVRRPMVQAFPRIVYRASD